MPLHGRIQGDTVFGYHMHGSGFTVQHIMYSWKVVICSHKFIDEALLWGARSLLEQKVEINCEAVSNYISKC